MKIKAKILDREGIQKAVTRISHEILERNKEKQKLVIVGIRNRGEHLAHRIVNSLERITGNEVPLGRWVAGVADAARELADPDPVLVDREPELAFLDDDVEGAFDDLEALVHPDQVLVLDAVDGDCGV